MESRRPDKFFYRASGLESVLSSRMNSTGTKYCIYGSQAYVHRPWLHTAYPCLNANYDQPAFNSSMNAARTVIE